MGLKHQTPETPNVLGIYLFIIGLKINIIGSLHLILGLTKRII